MAGYNPADAEGVTDWEDNTDGLIGIVITEHPTIVGTTELSNLAANKMLPRFDRGMSSFRRAPGGSDGRYLYGRTTAAKLIDSGKYEAPASTLLNGDTKQAAWTVYDVDGIRVLIVCGHLENQRAEGADALRVAQGAYFRNRSLNTAETYGVTADRVLHMHDTNSPDDVPADFTTAGWTAHGPGYATTWSHTGTKATDWVFTNGSTAKVTRKPNPYADHTYLRINWTVRQETAA